MTIVPSDTFYFLVYGRLTIPLPLRSCVVSNSIMIVNTGWQSDHGLFKTLFRNIYREVEENHAKP